MKTTDYFSQECNISTNFEIKENFIKKFEECKKKFPEFIVVWVIVMLEMFIYH